MPDKGLFGKLFLLEFFIDNIEIRNSSLIFGENNNGQLCVSFQFLYYPETEICEEDFTPKTRALAKTSKVIFKSGKSCLFSHHDPHISNLSAFDLKINVSQKLVKPDEESYKVPLGTAVISLGGSFMKILRNSVENTDSPLFSVAQDEFLLRDEVDNEVGTILAFVRLSCFGQLIITQFQLGTEKQYMFKGTDKVAFEDNKMSGNAEQNEEEIRNVPYENNEETVNLPGDTPYSDLFNYDEPNEKGVTELENKDNKQAEGINEDGNVAGEAGGDKKVENVDDDEEDEYKEYGAEVNGNSIKIRVLKKKNKERKSKKESDPCQKNVCCSNMNFCECDIEIPPPPPPEKIYPDCSEYLCEESNNCSRKR